jgi:hypothetical protein
MKFGIMIEICQQRKEEFETSLLPEDALCRGPLLRRSAASGIPDKGLRGIYVNSHVNGKPLDSPEFMPLYEKLSHYNLPIYIHPRRVTDFADYKTETEAKYDTNSVFGWVYDTTAAMTRLEDA